MESVLYQRIKLLCAEKGISINKLESTLGLGLSSIQKWKTATSPSIEKIMKIANYFDVSLDYLVGRQEIKGSAADILKDEDIISFQRAKENMPPKEKELMMTMIRAGFNYAFDENEEDDNT